MFPCFWVSVSFVAVVALVQSLSCIRLCNAMDCSTPGFPVLYHLLEFAQTHIRWVHDDIQPISSSVSPFSSCPQSFSESRSFPMNQLFSSGGQSIGASASILPVTFQGWFPLGLTGLSSLLSKGLSSVCLKSTVSVLHERVPCLCFCSWLSGQRQCVFSACLLYFVLIQHSQLYFEKCSLKLVKLAVNLDLHCRFCYSMSYEFMIRALSLRNCRLLCSWKEPW